MKEFSVKVTGNQPKLNNLCHNIFMIKIVSGLSLLSLLFLFSLTAKGQGHGFPFGSVTPSELSMTHYSLDSSASAVVFDEFGEIYNSYEDRILFIEVHKKIKILKKDGLDLANFAIRLERRAQRDEKLVSIKGITYYYENGKIRNSSLDEKAVLYEKNSDHYLLKFTLPNVRVGCVFEIKYIISGFPRYNLYPWKFQSNIPKVKSEFWALIRPAYSTSLQGFLELSLNESSVQKNCFLWQECVLLKFGMIDIPAFKEEEFMSAAKNYTSTLNFQPNWRDMEWESVVASLYGHENFGVQIKKARSLFKDDIRLMTSGATDSLEKAKKIYSFVRAQLSLNENYYPTKYAIDGAKTTYETKRGSVGDINLSLVAALQEAGINANPVILSTRENGFPNHIYPTLIDFNYVIVHLRIGRNEYLLDATDDFLPFGLIPQKCLNGKGWIVKKNPVEIDLVSKAKRKSVISLNIKLSDDGLLKGNAQITHYDYAAVDKRKTIVAFSDKEEYVKELEIKLGLNEIKNYEVTNQEEIEKPLVEKMEVSFDGSQANNSKQIYFNPFLKGRWQENPFKSTERKFSVDFGMTQDEVILISIEYPANYRLDDIPKNVVLTLPNKGGKLYYNCANVGNKLNISYSLNLTKSVYAPDEYLYLKELFSQIIQIRQTDLVLVRNN
jgi:hypothetical protein